RPRSGLRDSIDGLAAEVAVRLRGSRWSAQPRLHLTSRQDTEGNLPRGAVLLRHARLGIPERSAEGDDRGDGLDGRRQDRRAVRVVPVRNVRVRADLGAEGADGAAHDARLDDILEDLGRGGDGAASAGQTAAPADSRENASERRLLTLREVGGENVAAKGERVGHGKILLVIFRVGEVRALDSVSQPGVGDLAWRRNRKRVLHEESFPTGETVYLIPKMQSTSISACVSNSFLTYAVPLLR